MDGRRYSEYDAFAAIYNKHWGVYYPDAVMPILEETLLVDLRPKDSILDLCCGAGHLTTRLQKRGYCLTGIDGSEEMLKFARQNAPLAEFISADARAFSLPEKFRAVISTFESLNHIMTLTELERVFSNIHSALLPGGILFFDLITEKAYITNWSKSAAFVEEENVCVIHGGYDAEAKIARSEITLFHLGGGWTRRDVVLRQKYHPAADVKTALEKTGFRSIRIYDAKKRFKMQGDLGDGRLFFRAEKRNSEPPGELT